MAAGTIVSSQYSFLPIEEHKRSFCLQCLEVYMVEVCAGCFPRNLTQVKVISEEGASIKIKMPP